MRAAIIGCGPSGPACGGAHSISYAHARAMVRWKEDIELVAAASRSAKNLGDFSAEFPGVRGCTDYREMLRIEKPDFVSVCAFPPDREAMVLAALEAGARGVWVEKPFAISLAAADRMLEAADRCGARLFVNFQRRYGRPFEWVKEAIGRGRIGALTGVQICQPGTTLVDFGPHLIDAALHGMNEPANPTHVLAAVGRSEELYQGVPIEAQLVGTVHFSNGVRITVESGTRSAKRVPILRFDGELGFAELRLSPLPGESGFARGSFAGSPAIEVCEGEENFHHGTIDTNLYVDRALADILKTLRTGGACRLDARTVLPGLEILLALFQSAREQAMISLPMTERNSPFF